MATVLVYEYPDDVDIQEAADAALKGKPLPGTPRLHVAIREDADKILAIFPGY
jgi:hypothetical protein